MLGEVGIHTHADEYAATLSGGQRNRSSWGGRS